MSQLGKNKKIAYGLVLAAAVVGLLIDRLYLAPSSAEAAEETTSKVSQTRAADHDAESDEELPVLVSRLFVQRQEADSQDQLQAGESADPVRDAFAMTDEMERFVRVQAGLPASQPAGFGPMGPKTAEQFQQAHQLEGTFKRGDIVWAIIDGQILKVGDMIEDFRLAAIEDYRAILVRGEEKVVLQMPLPGSF